MACSWCAPTLVLPSPHRHTTVHEAAEGEVLFEERMTVSVGSLRAP
jgi:hypothetical protein